MAVKYVKDFAFDSGFGFTGSSGKTPVRAYMRGGAVKNNPTKAPSFAPAMVEKTSKGLGGKASETKKLAAYNKPHTEGKKGANVPMYAKGGTVKKAHAKKAKPSFLKGRMMRKAEGGPVDEILPGDGASPLQAMASPYGQEQALRKSARPPLDPITGEYGDMPEDLPYDAMRGISLGDRLPPMDINPADMTEAQRTAALFQMLERDTERMRGDAARQMRDLEMIGRPVPEEPVYAFPDPTPPRLIAEEDPNRYREMPSDEIPVYAFPDPTPPRLIAEEDPNRYREMIADMQRSVQEPSAPSASAPMMQRPVPVGLAPPRPSPLARAGMDAARTARRDMRADRRDTARDIMDRYIAGPRRAMPAPRRAMPAPRRAMPVAPQRPMIQPPREPGGGIATFAKGGKVGKTQAKIGKVMGEFKRGELHSGSKKGPVVKNPKQAVAIALSEAGAKKKAAGGGVKAAVHKHERAKHPGKPLTKLRMGGKACG